MNKKIDKLRSKIDEIDDRIAPSLVDRLKLAEEIVTIKRSLGIEVYDPDRETEIVERLAEKPSFDKSDLRKIYSEIFKISKKKARSEAIKNASLKELLGIYPILIAGPCAVESAEQIDKIAEYVAECGVRILRGGAYKPRTSPKSFQGVGKAGLRYLREAADKRKMFVISEFLDSETLREQIDYVDVIQIGARNMASYGLLKKFGTLAADAQKPVMLKRGFSAGIEEFLSAAEYLTESGVEDVLLCLRGVRTFEQAESEMRFSPDLGAILELKSRTDLPVLFDPSHSTGLAEYVEPISRAALSLGADGLMIESHFAPEDSLVDARQTISPSVLKNIIDQI